MKLHKAFSLLLAMIALALSACTTMVDREAVGADLFMEDFPEVSVNDIARETLQDEIKIGDMIDVQVYDVEALSKQYLVNRSGVVNFPLIGPLGVEGLNTSELEGELMTRYGESYLRDPSINVRIEQRSLGNVVVDGAVREPGVFEVANVISLSEAIALAKGLNSETTNGSSIFIIRTVEGQRRIREIDMREVRSFQIEEVDIIPSDIIFVDQSPGRVAFNTLLRTSPLLTNAIILSNR